MSDMSNLIAVMFDNKRMSKEFGVILEDLIKSHKVSVRQFAKDIGQKPSTVNEWVGKNGRFPASPEILKRMAEYFEISVHELLYGEPERNKQDLVELLQKTEIHTGLYEISIRKVTAKNQ